MTSHILCESLIKQKNGREEVDINFGKIHIVISLDNIVKNNNFQFQDFHLLSVVS